MGAAGPAVTPGPGGYEAGGVAIRINQIGYLPERRKVAVVCATEPADVREFEVVDARGEVVLGPRPAARAFAPPDNGGFGPCVETYRLDFSEITREGEYFIRAAGVTSPRVRVGTAVYAGVVDTLLGYMRQQRSLYNPLLRDSVHEDTDGILVDHGRAGEFIYVAGGWADAADYLQYVTTSANATYLLLAAYRDHPGEFGDGFDAAGLPGANGIPDVLDEARWGLEWLLRMHPEDDLLLNQLGDDRDHSFPDLPTTDSSDYGWGKGGYRPVYPCTGRPQGLLGNLNRSSGYASTAGKFVTAFAAGHEGFETIDPAFAARLAPRAMSAWALGRLFPGVCQTAPARAPYFYEEENWVDDMELAATQLHAMTGESGYLRAALDYAAREPVTPWMGRDTARHYEFFPWHNQGHYELWRLGRDAGAGARAAEYYRRGLDAVASRATNGFLIGVPFIWCSNNLIVSLATQAMHYRRMTGDTTFAAMEAALVDWLFGANPWGTSMVVGVPADGVFPRDPHSILSIQMGWETQKGGLVDGPVYRSIFENLLGIHLAQPDEYERWNGGFIVYHDDYGDYSTNEPIMDGTANLIHLLAGYAGGR